MELKYRRIEMARGNEAYRKRQAACDCLKPSRRDKIEVALDFADDFSDGAFMAYTYEQGIDVSELECFSEEHDCQKVSR